MSDALGEELITAFLTTVARVGRTMASRSAELTRSERLSGVTSAVEIWEFDVGEPDKRVAVDGYVDGELEGVGGFAWSFTLLREGSGWILERELLLNATGTQETVQNLPVVAFATSEEVVRRLPDLIEELLRTPPP